MAKTKAAAAASEDASVPYVIPGLSPEQVAARAKGLGGSDAERIMTGDWYKLWAEKTGRQKPDDLSRVLPVQMGNVSEAFNAHWFQLMTDIPVNRSPSVTKRTHVHPAHPWMLCNIDGLVLIDGRMRLLECKHTNPFGSKAESPAKYLAQIQHNLEVLDLEGCELSVFFGNTDWQRFSLERDRDYGQLLIDREAEFWAHVQGDKPPERSAADAAPPARFDIMRQINFRPNNTWGDEEATWVRTREHVQQGTAAEAALKAMMPADCDFAFGHELVCVRDRAGKLTLRYPNKKDTLRVDEALEAEREKQAKEDEFSL